MSRTTVIGAEKVLLAGAGQSLEESKQTEHLVFLRIIWTEAVGAHQSFSWSNLDVKPTVPSNDLITSDAATMRQLRLPNWIDYCEA